MADLISEQEPLIVTTQDMRILLYACLVSMALLAILFLRRRQLTLEQYLLWGLLAVMLPILGPYLVIASRPGQLLKP